MKQSINEKMETGVEPESQFKLLMVYFKHNPGLMLSVSYLMLTLCGIFYSMSFYREFSINIMKLADVADLLIIGISEPAAILMFWGGLMTAWAMDKVMLYSYPIQQRWLIKPHSLKRSLILLINYVPKTREGLLSAFIFMFVAFSYAFVSLYAEWRGNNIKTSKEDFVVVSTEASKSAVRYKLLGSTSNYVFVYAVQSKQSVIIPVEQVSSLMPEMVQSLKKTESKD